LVDFGGRICVLSAPEDDLKLNVGVMLSSEVYMGGSMVGGVNYIKKMLNFAAEHNIRPLVEVLPMSECNKGIEKVRTGNVRYRVVLENKTPGQSSGKSKL
ncbi:hypothetical protein BB559_006415, partial [Furculomyces boomerangus]